MARLKLTLAYVGTDLSGWQFQDGTRTVQACLEDALAAILGGPVRVHGASRTDAGVHALGQVAHVDVPEERMRIPWVPALNSKLPPDVVVTSAERVSDEFHARYDVIEKTYAYALWLTPNFVWPQRKAYVWRVPGVDLAAMDAVLPLFTGRRDFAAFQNTGTPVSSTVRTVTRFARFPGETPHEVVYRITADGFLKQMVRNIMGCLVAVGRGRLTAEGVEELFAGRDRTLAPETAPGWPLCLEEIVYPETATPRER